MMQTSKVKMASSSNRGKNVYTPGSVDSWDMENLNFLRKMRQSGNNNNNGRQDLDAVSYVSTSDAESAIYEDRTIVGDLTSEDEKGRHAASIYGRRGGGNLSTTTEDDSDYGMSSNNGDSESQTPTRLLDEALYSGGNGFALLNKSIVMKQMKSMAASTLKDPYLEDETKSESESIIQPTTIVRKNPLHVMSSSSSVGSLLSRKNGSSRVEDSHFDRRFMKNRKSKPSLVTAGFMEPRLEDCYLLDVMTIRNESVLAERGRTENTRHVVFSSSDSQDSESDCTEKTLKLNASSGRGRSGSAGLPSSSSSTSSVSSSSDEFTSAREGSYFVTPGEDDPIEIHRDSSPEGTRASSCSPVSVVVRGECTATTSTRFQSGYSKSSDRSFATASSNYYYLGQQQEDYAPYEDDGIEDRSNSNSKDSLQTLETTPTPRSPSPYYVRLRRDLIPPSYTPPHQRQPWNFGMNRQGLLVIDYSPNWDGLESYVRSLSIQN